MNTLLIPVIYLISWLLLIGLIIPTGYILLLAFASIRVSHSLKPDTVPISTRFLIAIPAHNEGAVIASTVRRLQEQHYPPDLYQIHVVADYCTDDTIQHAQSAGVIVHERCEGERTGKGAALSWLFQKTIPDGNAPNDNFDAVVVFDADTYVDPAFLSIMNARLHQGYEVIQGQHIIRNPEQGWFPALVWAMFIVDNRYQNLGRSNIGWSAKNMGDSICLKTETIRRLGWGEGLTEDYQLRHKLLMNDIKIFYEPEAKGYGEAPLSIREANAQRSRWLRGTRQSSRYYALKLWKEGIHRHNWALLDSAMQASSPSYSSLTMLSFPMIILYVIIALFIHPTFEVLMGVILLLEVLIIFFYPFLGLALEHAPLKAYLAITIGPIYIVWRTWLLLRMRILNKPVTWVRTEHGKTKDGK